MRVAPDLVVQVKVDDGVSCEVAQDCRVLLGEPGLIVGDEELNIPIELAGSEEQWNQNITEVMPDVCCEPTKGKYNGWHGMLGGASRCWLRGIQRFDGHLLDPGKVLSGLSSDTPLFTIRSLCVRDIHDSGRLTNGASITAQLTYVEAQVGKVTDRRAG
jgi:hypothetical protein